MQTFGGSSVHQLYILTHPQATVATLIAEMRLQRAKNLLLTTDLSVATVGFRSGYLTDRLSRRSVAAVPMLTGALMVAALPAYLIALLTHDLTVMVVAMLIGGTLIFGAGPSLFAGIHIVCGSRRRATAIALLYFMMNSIGLGGGPALTGVLSDAFGAAFGSAMGLRIAMLTAFAFLLPGGACFLAACRAMRSDAED